MRPRKLMLIGLSGVGMLFAACSDDFANNNADIEAYTKSFIERYNIPEDGHMFNMSQRSKVTVKCTEPRDVQIVAEVGGKKYSFARYTAISGTTDVNFSIPRGVSEVYVVTGSTMLPVKIGATIDLDNIESYLSNFTFDNPSSRDGSGYDYFMAPHLNDVEGKCGLLNINHDYLNIDIANSGSSFTIWELNHILDYYRGVADCNSNYWTFDDADDLRYLSVVYWEKPNGHDIEIGLINTADPTDIIPMYTTKGISNGSIVGKYGFKTDADNSVAEIEIRYSTDESVGYQKQTHVKWNDYNYFHVFLSDIYKNVDFLPKLAAYVNVQAKFPDFDDYKTTGSNRYESQGVVLPVYDSEDPLPYCRAWEAFLYCYANDPANTEFTSTDREALAAVKNFIALKEYWAQHAMIFQYAYSYPRSVTKIDDITYKIRFEGAMHEEAEDHHDQYIISTSTQLIDPTQPGNNKYRTWGWSIYLPQTDGVLNEGINPDTHKNNTYAVYVKDLSTNAIIASTLEGNTTSTAGRLRWICDERESGNVSDGVIAFDLDDDDKKDDLIIFRSGRGGYGQSWNFEPFMWIIACEDLGNTDDVDFNDMVVGVSFEDTNEVEQEITIKPLAAGGIYPAYLAYTDGEKRYIIGTEIHKWLGQTELEPYNTGDSYISEVTNCTPCKFTFNKLDHDGNSFSVGATASVVEGEGENAKTYEIWTGANMGGFSIIVDKNDAHGNQVGDDIARKGIDFSVWTDVNQITAPGTVVNGSKNIAPMMICVGGDWEWPTERTRIEEAYPAFTKWVGNTSYRWYGEGLAADDAQVPENVTRHK